jgi:hypothetical protein
MQLFREKMFKKRGKQETVQRKFFFYQIAYNQSDF